MSASAASPPAATPDDVRNRRPASLSSKTHRARGCQRHFRTGDFEEDREVSSIAPQDHPLLTGENDSENEHAPSPTDVFAAEPYEEGSPKKKQRVA